MDSKAKTAARERFARSGFARDRAVTFDDMADLYRSKSFVELGEMFGVTKQAMQRRFKTYFEPVLGPASGLIKERHKHDSRLKREAALKEKLDARLADPVFLFLKEEARKRGKKIRPLVDCKDAGILPGRHPVFYVEGRYMRLHRIRRIHCPAVGQQRYASFRVHLSMLDRVHVYGMLIDVPGFPRRLILARTAVIKGMIKRGNGKHWNFYIPLRDDRPSVPAPSQRTDIRKFVDAWWTFDV